MAKLSKNKERKLKKVLREYSNRLGLPDPGERFTFRQHLIRICSRFPKIAAYVRPTGGKVSGDQTKRMVEYMCANPIGDFDPNALIVNTPSGPRPKRVRDNVGRNPKIDRRIRKEARDVEHQKRADFYHSWEWKRLRYQALQKHGLVCMCCGAERGDTNAQGHPVKIVVDHVKPIRKYWHLRLDPANLQVLCDECNMGKGSWDETDWRPDEIKQQLKYVI